MEELGDYVKWKNLSPETQKKVFSYYETKYRGKFFEEESLLLEMNESLRAEISLQNTRTLIARVPFLRRQMNDGRDEIFFGRIATILRPQYFVKNDNVIKQGDYAFDMYFILSGTVNVFVNDRKVVTLYDGAYFGEVALIAKVLRTATVRAATPSVLYRLTHKDFHNVLEEFEDMKMRIDALQREHEAKLKTAGEGKEDAVAKLRRDSSDG
ncbi:UNVERIFIED_CONTAM: anaphase-promoting complex subunit Hcn1 [Siphonaria sp. JEL0065]|nr:anaphase-promoting complex subunit Hcn1 [Siphonaria sp. JEL0065]